MKVYIYCNTLRRWQFFTHLDFIKTLIANTSYCNKILQFVTCGNLGYNYRCKLYFHRRKFNCFALAVSPTDFIQKI